jgi:peptide deformylase
VTATTTVTTITAMLLSLFLLCTKLCDSGVSVGVYGLVTTTIIQPHRPYTFELSMSSTVPVIPSSFTHDISRRDVVRTWIPGVAAFATLALTADSVVAAAAATTTRPGDTREPPRVTPDIVVEGTHLPHLSPEQAVATYCRGDFLTASSQSQSSPSMLLPILPILPMAQWPDPVLRIPAHPVPAHLFGTDELRTLAKALRNTCRQAGAVGLAAQQCGVDASMVFLETQDYQTQAQDNTDCQVVSQVKKRRIQKETTKSFGYGFDDKDGILLINPRFVARSSELDMNVWREECLVLPPWFRATVLRDDQVVVEAECLETGHTFHVSLKGELSRAVQHECQHDRGILIMDHIDVVDMDVVDDDESSCVITRQMQQLEFQSPLHEQRQDLAFARSVVASTI